ncbi:unannotated protein [freshwater metagenome]|uniref:Unannotated protein n=1 Tax=freshwater metagenome TaxID=449393 RepID=A0A6J7H420_9ZZZZ|nr:hypothetical protein [Actinomycetota bacterium]
MTNTTPTTPNHQTQPDEAPELRRFLVTQSEQFVVWATDENDACERLLEMDRDEEADHYHGTIGRSATWVNSALQPERP